MATNLYKKYETDPTKERDGVELEFDGVTFICKRAGGSNRMYLFAMSEAIEKYRQDAESKIPEKVVAAENAATMEAFATAVVTGWKDVLDRKDQPMEFTKENFIDLMRACPDVWAWLRSEARELEHFRMVQTVTLAEELGNSSSGTQPGVPT